MQIKNGEITVDSLKAQVDVMMNDDIAEKMKIIVDKCFEIGIYM